jgi:2-polyprenyl-6-methoxyphenol hydroxylase-like FAD-dependent oxidoreductase
MSQSSVVILGSGLGGLTLGRCLRQKGISSVIYERASSVPRHTYGITLQPWAYKPLLGLLNIDELTFRRHVAVDSLNLNGVGRVSAGDAGSSTAFRANRNKLESMLREGQTVQLEHSLSSAAISDDDGSVELRFQNGLKLRPTQVVDVLGVHSQLRKSLLPDVTLDVQPFVVYSSKRYVKADLFTSTYARAFGDGNVLVRNPSHHRDPRLEITINDHLPNGNVSINYVYSRAARNDSNATDPLHHPERPIAGATDIPEEFYDELNDFITAHDVGQPFIECLDLDQIRTERLLHWLMRTIMVPKQELLRLLQHGIVMIGDTAHAVPILGGHGANMAILDAINLADVLAEQKGETTGLKDFYEDRWPGWHEAVEQSKKELVEMHRGSPTNLATSNL